MKTPIEHTGNDPVVQNLRDSEGMLASRISIRRVLVQAKSALITLLIVTIATGLCELLKPHFALPNLIMVYLLSVTVVSSWFGAFEAVLASVLSVLAFDFFFVHPAFTFDVSDKQYLLTFGVMLVVALLISSLTLRLRRQAVEAKERESKTASLYAVSKELEAEKARNVFLSSVSHDLRTPLTAINGAATILLAHHPSPEDEEHKLALLVVSESERLNRHVRNLLDITRLEGGNLNLSREWNSLEELVGAALTHTEIQLVNHKVETKTDPSVPLVWVDGVLVEKAIINLLENAARFSPDESTIWITVRLQEHMAKIEIADDGPGVPVGFETKIFEKFYQTKDESGRGRGVGLGLAICKAVMDAHGGRVYVGGGSGYGATFSLEFPLNDNAPELPNES